MSFYCSVLFYFSARFPCKTVLLSLFSSPDKWEDDIEGPSFVVLNKKTYQCDVEQMPCDCPKLLCTRATSCEKGRSNRVRCELYKSYEQIDLNDAKRLFFRKGDCGCRNI